MSVHLILAFLLIPINDFWLILATGSGYNTARTRATYVEKPPSQILRSLGKVHTEKLSGRLEN